MNKRTPLAEASGVHHDKGHHQISLQSRQWRARVKRTNYLALKLKSCLPLSMTQQPGSWNSATGTSCAEEMNESTFKLGRAAIVADPAATGTLSCLGGHDKPFPCPPRRAGPMRQSRARRRVSCIDAIPVSVCFHARRPRHQVMIKLPATTGILDPVGSFVARTHPSRRYHRRRRLRFIFMPADL